MAKYHGPALSSGPTLQEEQITQRNVGGDAQPYYTGGDKCSTAHESHRARVLIIVSVRLEHSHSGRQKIGWDLASFHYPWQLITYKMANTRKQKQPHNYTWLQLELSCEDSNMGA